MACLPCEAAARARARARLKANGTTTLLVLGGAALVVYLLVKGTGTALGNALGGSTPQGGA
jgi:hypothetical protein